MFTVWTCFNLVWWFPHFSSVFFHLAIAILSGWPGVEQQFLCVAGRDPTGLFGQSVGISARANSAAEQRWRGRCLRDRMGRFSKHFTVHHIFTMLATIGLTKYMRYMRNRYFNGDLLQQKQWSFHQRRSTDTISARPVCSSKVPSGNDSHGLQGGWSRWFQEHVYQCFLVDLCWSSEMWPLFLHLFTVF